jgi:hypothetical protein
VGSLRYCLIDTYIVDTHDSANQSGLFVNGVRVAERGPPPGKVSLLTRVMFYVGFLLYLLIDTYIIENVQIIQPTSV